MEVINLGNNDMKIDEEIIGRVKRWRGGK